MHWFWRFWRAESGPISAAFGSALIVLGVFIALAIYLLIISLATSLH